VVSEKKIGGSSAGEIRSGENSCRASVEKCLKNLHQNFHSFTMRHTELVLSELDRISGKTVPVFDSRLLIFGFSKVVKLFSVSSCFWQDNSNHYYRYPDHFGESRGFMNPSSTYPNPPPPFLRLPKARHSAHHNPQNEAGD
jgi:hypothetical protein